MMVPLRIATTKQIAAPAAHIWVLLTDFAGYGDWNPYIVRVDGAAQAPSQLTVHAVMRPGDPPLVQAVELVALAPFTMHWRGGMADRNRFVGNHFFALMPEADGTRLDHFEDFGGSVAAKILTDHGDMIRGNFERFNAALKARAELANRGA
jgi:hypothetical protein